MTYHLNRGLFVENGPTLVAERDRERRAAGHAYRLLGAARPVTPDTAETPPFSRAA